jgi:PAS domain S-box-containing protein
LGKSKENNSKTINKHANAKPVKQTTPLKKFSEQEAEQLIAELQNTQIELKIESEERQTLNRIILKTIETVNLNTRLEYVMDEALRIVDIEGGAICLVNSDDTLNLAVLRKSSVEVKCNLSENKIKIGDCLCGSCAKKCKPLILKNKLEVIKYAKRKELGSEDICFHASFPFVVAKRSVGVLCVFSNTNKKPSDRKIKLLETVVAQTAVSIENASLYENMKENEKKFSTIFLASPGSMILSSLADGKIIEVNNNFSLLTGYSRKEAIGKTTVELNMWNDPTQRNQFLSILNTEGKVVNFEANLNHKSGAIRNGLLSGHTFKIKDKGYLVGAFHDITDRKVIELSLKESEGKFSAIFDFSSTAYSLFDNNGKLLDVNPAFSQMTGYSHEEVIGKTIVELNLISSSDQQKMFESGNKDGSLNNFELDMVKRDGTVCSISRSRKKISINNKHYNLGIAINITERKQAEAALKESERRFRETLENVQLVSVLIDLEGSIKFCNNFLLKLTGYKHDEVIGKNWFTIFIPEKSSNVREEYLKGLRQGNIVSFLENPIRTKDGSERLIRFSNTLLRDEHGNVIGTTSIGEDITESKLVESALQKSEARYRSLFETAPDGILIVDKESYYLNANASMCRMLGYSIDELIGLNAVDIVVQSETRHIEPAIDKIISESKYYREWKFKRKDGFIFSADVSVSVMPDGNFMAMIRDTTERKQAEEELRYHQELIREMGRVAKIGGWEFDAITGKGTWTEETARIHDLDPQEETNVEKALKFYSVDSLLKIENAIKEAVEIGKSYDLELEITTAKGLKKWVKSIGHPLEKNGKVVKVRGSFQDITEHKRVDEELRHHRENLEELVKQRTYELELAKERAESADKIKSAFLATMSHELRTPLNSIIGFTGILIRERPGPLNSEQKKQLGIVQNSSRHLLTLINDVLDLSKIEAGQLKVYFEPFNLPEIIYKVAESQKPVADKKNILIDVLISDEIKIIVGDKLRIQQIILNVLNNAIKFTLKGSVKIECESVGKNVLIKITDTGIGIEKEQLDKLFKPFSQVESGLTRSYEGTGLGLSICKKLLSMLNGSIQIESEFGKGSTITIVLPKDGKHDAAN